MFTTKIRMSIALFQERVRNLELNGKTLGLYGGGLNMIELLKPKLELRFFDGDVNKQGKYYSGYENPIENPKNLLFDKVDELWVMAIDYNNEIIDYLKNDLKLPDNICIFSYKDFLEKINYHYLIILVA